MGLMQRELTLSLWVSFWEILSWLTCLNTSVSVLDIADKLNRTIHAGMMTLNIPNLLPSYGAMWCPSSSPNKGMPLNIGVEWTIGCGSEQITVASLKNP